MEAKSRLQVGIDIGMNKADYAVLHPNGELLEMHRGFANNPEGYLKAREMLLKTLQQQNLEGLDIGVEATSYYWLPLYIQIYQDPELAQYHPRQALLNAGWVKWYKKSFPPDHKSDKSDPFYIAERLRTLPRPNWWQYDPHWLTLRLRTRMRLHLMRSLSREKNHYQLFLFLGYSGYSQVKPFTDVFGWVSQQLLRQPQLLDELGEMSVDELEYQLADISQHHLKNTHETAARLYQALHGSYSVPEDLDPCIQSALFHLNEVIQLLQQQIVLVDEEIAACVKDNYPEVAWLDSIPGLGQVFASGIAAEIAGLQRFSSPLKWDVKSKCYRQRDSREVEDAIAKYAGLWWPQNSSGKFEAEEKPMSKRGNAYLRYFILLAADRMRLYIPSYARFYQKKFRQANKHQHKRALVLTGRKALGLFVGLLHHQEFYRPEEVEG